jgi:hypothetical protein
LEQVALVLIRAYGVVALTMGVGFFFFALIARLFPCLADAIVPYLSHYAGASVNYAIVHLVSGGLLLAFSRRLSRFLVRP